MAGRPLRRERIARENGRFAKLPVYAVSVVVKRDPWEMLPEDEPTFSVTYHVQTDKGVDAAEMLGTSRARQEYGADRVLDAEAVPAVDPARGNPKFSGYPKPYGSRPDGFPETDLNKATQFVFNIAGTEVTTRDSRGKYIEVAGRGEAWKQYGNRKGWRIVDYRPESEFYVFIVPPGDFEQFGSRGKRALRRAVDTNRDFWENAPFQVLKREVARRTPETPRDPARARSNPWQDDLNPHGNLQSALHRVSILAREAQSTGSFEEVSKYVQDIENEAKVAKRALSKMY